MIKLWEPVVGIIFYEIIFFLNRYKTWDVSVSKVRKTARIGNQYNQVQHLFRDTK